MGDVAPEAVDRLRGRHTGGLGVTGPGATPEAARL
jgi:hypothetical protein